VLRHLSETVEEALKGREAEPEPTAEEDQPRRRSRRMTTTQMAESMAAESGIQPAASEGKSESVPNGEVATPVADASASAAPASDAPAPVVDAPAPDSAQATEQPAG